MASGKERVVLLPAKVYQEVLALRTEKQAGKALGDDDPVWRSRGGGRGHSGSPLDRSQIHRIVEAAAIRADVATYLGKQERTVKGTTQTVVKEVTKSASARTGSVTRTLHTRWIAAYHPTSCRKRSGIRR